MPTDRPGADSAKTFGLLGLFLAMALAAGVEIAVAARSPAIAKDGVTFIRLAQRLSESPAAAMRQADQHPGYPALILAARWMLRAFHAKDGLALWLNAARAPSMLLGLLSLAPFWLLVRRAMGPRAAAVAAVLFAILPVFRENASDALSDSACLFFYLSATWLLAEGLVRRRFWWFPAAGACAGLAFWIRPEGLGPAVAGGAVLLLLCVLRREKPLPTLARLAGLLAVAGVVVAPYVCIKGKITAKKDFSGLVVRSAPASPAAERPPATTARPGGALSFRAAAGAVLALVEHCAHSLRYFLLAPLAFGLFVRTAPSAEPLPRQLLIALAAVNVLTLLALHVVAGYLADRHTLPLDSVSLVWIAGGAIWLGERASSLASSRWKAARRLSPTAAAAILTAAAALSLLPRCLRPLHAQLLPLLRAADRVRADAAPGDALITNSPHVLLYAQLPGRVMGRDETLLGDGRSDSLRRFRFIVLDRTLPDFSTARAGALGESYETIEGAPGGRDDPLVLVRRPAPGQHGD